MVIKCLQYRPSISSMKEFQEKKKKKKSLHTGNGSPGSLTDPTTAFLRISPKNQIRRGKVQQGLNFRMDAF